MKVLAAHPHSWLKILNQELISRAQREIVPPTPAAGSFKALEAAGMHSATWLLLGLGHAMGKEWKKHRMQQ